MSWRTEAVQTLPDQCPLSRYADVKVVATATAGPCVCVCVCAVDGMWSAWSEWSPCKSPFDPQRDIHCLQLRGSQKRRRECLHRAHNGTICSGETQSQTQACYDVHRCYCRWRRRPPGQLTAGGGRSLC